MTKRMWVLSSVVATMVVSIAAPATTLPPIRMVEASRVLVESIDFDATLRQRHTEITR